MTTPNKEKLLDVLSMFGEECSLRFCEILDLVESA
jgi:hypothetical protein